MVGLVMIENVEGMLVDGKLRVGVTLDSERLVLGSAEFMLDAKGGLVGSGAVVVGELPKTMSFDVTGTWRSAMTSGRRGASIAKSREVT